MPFPYFSLTAKKVCKETLSAASSPTAVGCPHSTFFFSKNTKLALLRQLYFLHVTKELPFSSADALTHSSGKVSMHAKAKAFIHCHMCSRYTIYELQH